MGRRKQGKYPYTHIPLAVTVPTYAHTSSFSLGIDLSQIPNSGNGVFVHSFIPACSYIDEYVGEHKMYNPMTGYYLRVSDTDGIDAHAYPRCYMAMINDPYRSTFRANCEFRIEDDRACVWSTCDIYPNEELFIDYGSDYFT